jgi:hypothetical protein
MANETERISELLSTPMEAAVVGLAVGIARAQTELDRHSILLQREIDEDPELADLGLHATWYQMPRAELELTMAVTLEEDTAAPTAPGLTGPLVASRFLAANQLRAIRIAPVNAFYKNQFDFDVSASSKLKLTFVPVPPPVGDSIAPARMTRDDVMNTAKSKLKNETDTRVSVNFNGAARLWFVLEYRLDGDVVNRRALVVIDDETGSIIKTDEATDG